VSDLVNPTEMYLRTLHDLNEDGLEARQARIVERLGVTHATVGQAVTRLARAGMVSTTDAGRIELTPEGRAQAVAIARKHRLAERLLTDVIGLPPLLAHDEACRLEHVMSEAVERRIIALLDHPETAPWGNPIPGLDRLGVVAEERPAAMRLVDIPSVRLPAQGTVRSVSEQAQADGELMAALIRAGVAPGARVSVRRLSRSYRVTGVDVVEIPKRLAHVLRIDCD
jgi:DtxR family transcriptional regulator, Mn-dependent transcriptional regulator